MTIAKQYDYLNRLTSINTTVGAASVAKFAYGYNAANQRTNAVTVDNSFWVYQYDSLGQVVSGKKYWSDGSPVAGQQFEYAYDDIGNRTVTRSGGDQMGLNLRAAGYTANLLNQYTSRTVPSFVDVLGSANSSGTVSVNNQRASRKGSYFRGELGVDNTLGPVWLSVTNLGVLNNGSNPDIITSTTGNIFVPKTPEVFGYDLDGNLTGDGRWTLAWDAENRLISMTAKTNVGPQLLKFEYDAKGRRIHKQVWNNTQGTNSPILDQKFVYDDWNLTAILDAQFALARSFTWGLDLSGTSQGAGGVGGLLWINQGLGSSRQFSAFDGNGNTVALISGSDGTSVGQYEYDPFGRTIRNTGIMALNNPFRFSTKFTDDETDLVYYGYRYCAPSTGRWIARDPAGEEQGGPNLYGFVANAPSLRVDRDGRTFSDDPSGTLVLIPMEKGLSGACGAAYSRIEFYVFGGQGVNGWIIQHVKIETKVTDCCGNPVKPKNTENDFSEGWKVIDGVAIPGDDKPVRRLFTADDTFTTLNEGRGTKGTIKITGKIKFIKSYNLTYPPWNREGHDEVNNKDVKNESGILPNIDGTPKGWSDDGALDHTLTVEFDCCSFHEPTLTTIP